MDIVIPGQSHQLTLDCVARASGAPIIAGTVTFYLKALSGTNAGKWFRASDSTWQAAEAVAGIGTHSSDGHWEVTVSTDAWIEGVRYDLYLKESGNLHIPVKDRVYCKSILAPGDQIALPGGQRILGPSASAKLEYIPFATFTDGTTALCARPGNWEGVDLTIGEVASATYTVFKITTEDFVQTLTAVDDFTDVSLTLDDDITGATPLIGDTLRIYDPVRSDSMASDYTLVFVPDVTEKNAFEEVVYGLLGDLQDNYVVELRINLVEGQPIVIKWKGPAI